LYPRNRPRGESIEAVTLGDRPHLPPAIAGNPHL